MASEGWHNSGPTSYPVGRLRDRDRAEHANVRHPHRSAEARARHDDLVQTVRDARYRYYVLSQPPLSDAEFDARFHEIEAIEQRYPELVTPESPTQQVGAPLDNAFPPFEHLEAMLSLDNAFSEAEVRTWAERVRRGLPEGRRSGGCASSRSTAPPSTASTGAARCPSGPRAARASSARPSRSSSSRCTTCPTASTTKTRPSSSRCGARSTTRSRRSIR